MAGALGNGKSVPPIPLTILRVAGFGCG